jgi:RNase adaptor protein for sRNA GlmZ degradation
MRRALLARKLGLESKQVFTPHTCGSYADVEVKGADPRWRKAMLSRRATAKQFESKISRVLMQARSETLAKLAALPDDTARSLHTKQGVAADFVFDLRVLPNPFYITDLRPHTGRDAAVARFMEEQPEAGELLTQIETFLRRWIPGFESDQRSYLTVALGCTGGQHRSVYGVELLAQRFKDRNATLVRHRELDTGE